MNGGACSSSYPLIRWIFYRLLINDTSLFFSAPLKKCSCALSSCQGKSNAIRKLKDDRYGDIHSLVPYSNALNSDTTIVCIAHKTLNSVTYL